MEGILEEHMATFQSFRLEEPSLVQVRPVFQLSHCCFLQLPAVQPQCSSSPPNVGVGIDQASWY